MSMGNLHWYFPAWNGDHRLEPDPSDPERTVLVIQDPTAAERAMLEKLEGAMVRNGWIDGIKWPRRGWFKGLKARVKIRAPLEKVGPLFVWAFRPGPAVLTAVRYEDGKVATSSEGLAELAALSEKIAAEVKEKPEAPKPKAAATVKRPTPSCPDCVPGSIEPAREVLLSFLSEEEHRTWAKERVIYVRGGLSGAIYRIAHRHTEVAREQTRICKDLDSNCTVHFHDTSVPPEEEVLAAKLILEHREPWLRNEATMLGLHIDSPFPTFKNPFGGFMDGVPDAQFTRAIGSVLSGGVLR